MMSAGREGAQDEEQYCRHGHRGAVLGVWRTPGGEANPHGDVYVMYVVGWCKTTVMNNEIKAPCTMLGDSGMYLFIDAV